MTKPLPPHQQRPLHTALSAPDPRVLVTLPSGKRVWMPPRRNAKASASPDAMRRTAEQVRKDEA